MSKDKREREKSSLKLHHYRFVKFMEYLKKHNAVIHILPEGASEGSSRRLEYDFKCDGNTNVKNLIIQAMKSQLHLKILNCPLAWPD